MNAPVESSLAPLVLTASTDGVRTLTLNRGDRFNALSREMIAALEAELDRVAADKAIRVVVLAGSGRGFCAGHDLKEMRAHADAAWQRELFDACSRMMLKLTRLPQPVIARVHGLATAAGCQLVSMCDLAVAADTAKFALPGVNVGVFCSTPAVGVGRNIARKRAMEMLLTGEAIDAATALPGASSTASWPWPTSMPRSPGSPKSFRARVKASWRSASGRSTSRSTAGCPTRTR